MWEQICNFDKFIIVIPLLPPAFRFICPAKLPLPPPLLLLLILLLLPDPPQAPTIIRILPPLTSPILLTTEFSERSTNPNPLG